MESPTRTPSSAHAASSSPPERSPVITGVSALSSPTAESAGAEVRTAVETLSDSDAGNATAEQRPSHHAAPLLASVAGPQQRSSFDAQVRITAADYADRRRLLNHITYLSTQLQRAQLQVEDLTRTTCVLRGLCSCQDGEKAAPDDSVAATAAAAATLSSSNSAAAARGAVADGATTAAVLAAQDEAEVHAALQAALAVFDPVIAQTQIYRLDDALAQMGLLREAELAQLQRASAALQEHRTLVARLSEEAAHLRSRTATLQQQKQDAEAQLAAATLELQRLRHEELRLNQRVAGLQELAQDGTWTSNVRVVGPAKPHAAAAALSTQLAQLQEEERLARQALLLDAFWDPMLIAFDAGLTWMSDSAALRRSEAAAVEKDAKRLPLVQTGVVVDTTPPPADADLLLLRRQQEEMAELRGRVQLLQDRNRLAELEKERLQFLYENEMRRSERMAQDHVAQLQQAYDEVVKDRQCIMNKLKGEVEEQLRLAFEDGRAYEKSCGSVPSRNRPSKKLLRSSNAVT
ncbi:hypothetical protein N2W54_006788 [Lotmaria passim]